MSAGYQQAPGYPGGPQQVGYPAGAYQGAPQAYPGGPPPPAGPYQGAPPPQGPYPGGPPPPAGPYQGAPPPQGSYPGGPPPPAGGYPGAPPSSSGEVQVQWKGEVPEHDVDDNPNAVASVPTAPPLEKMDTVAGYGNVGFDSAPLPPPSYDEAMRQEPPQREAVSGLPQIHEEEAREALLGFVAEHCCYGKGAARDLKFTDLRHSSAFHHGAWRSGVRLAMHTASQLPEGGPLMEAPASYTLETFGEGRSTSWAFTPYSGQPIDGPCNGPAPGPWDIQAQPPQMFQNQKTEIEVPHTASVKPCHNCMASGRVRCHRCYGRGRVRCTSCGGSGHRTVYRNGEHERERCTWCHGDGRRRCMTCHGYGMITCACCEGHCQLKCYIKLTILWTNHLEDHIVERTALPDHLIRSVSGQVAFEEQQLRVWPINHFPDSEINTASQRLVAKHGTGFPSERLLMQRHRVRVIPVTQAMYKYSNQDLDFFVYGFEKRVHAPTYPQQCCCGCSLL